MTDASEITSQNIDEFRPSRETLEEAIREFKNMGFEVLPDEYHSNDNRRFEIV